MKRANNTDGNRIWSRIKMLSNNPEPPQAARVVGYAAEIYRVRVGNYRIVYVFDDETLHIGVIERRDKVYQILRALIQSGAWQPPPPESIGKQSDSK